MLKDKSEDVEILMSGGEMKWFGERVPLLRVPHHLHRDEDRSGYFKGC